MQKEPRNKDDRTALSFYFLLYYKERCLRVLGYGLYVLLELSTVFGDSSPNHYFTVWNLRPTKAGSVPEVGMWWVRGTQG